MKKLFEECQYCNSQNCINFLLQRPSINETAGQSCHGDQTNDGQTQSTNVIIVWVHTLTKIHSTYCAR